MRKGFGKGKNTGKLQVPDSNHQKAGAQPFPNRHRRAPPSPEPWRSSFAQVGLEEGHESEKMILNLKMKFLTQLEYLSLFSLWGWEWLAYICCTVVFGNIDFRNSHLESNSLQDHSHLKSWSYLIQIVIWRFELIMSKLQHSGSYLMQGIYFMWIWRAKDF